jgi:AcrR family transcriptional regulator
MARATTASDTAERILDATLAVIVDHGIARMALEDVARRAGLSRQTVYRYFPSKGALLDATVLREEEVFIDNVSAAAAAHDDLAPAIEAAIAAALRTGRDHALLNRLLATEPESLLPLLTTDSGPVLSAARRATAAILAERLPDTPPARLQTAADAVARLVVSYVINPPADPPESVAARLAELLLEGLAPSTGQRGKTSVT